MCFLTYCPESRCQVFLPSLAVALVLGGLNVFLKPALVFLTFPVNILTLGIFIFVINAFLIETIFMVPLKFFNINRKKLKKVVLVGGAFDIIHAGHIEHLKKAKSLGDTLVVHIANDCRVREKKGNGRPIFSDKQRAFFVSSIRFVDYVFIHDGRHYDSKVIKAVKPDIIFFNKESYGRKIGAEIKKIRDFNGKIVVSRDKKINSTSRMLQLLKEKESQSAESNLIFA